MMEEEVDDLYKDYILYLGFTSISRKERQLKDRENILEYFDDESFYQKFHLSKSSVLYVLCLIQEKLQSSTKRNKPLSPLFQLITALKFYTTGQYQTEIGEFNSIAQSTTSYTIHKVSKAICGLREFISFPQTDDEIDDAISEFEEIAQFTGVVGAIGCTHIRIQSPGANGELFRNEFGYFSLKIQLIVDAKLKIRDIITKWQGSIDDYLIFANSKKRNEFAGGKLKGVLLGDQAYPCKPYLLTPVESPSTIPEERYNDAHCLTRSCMKRTVKLWKQRFPCLTSKMRCGLHNTAPAIVATAILHNIAIAAGEHENFDSLDTEVFEEISSNKSSTYDENTDFRDQFIVQHFA